MEEKYIDGFVQPVFIRRNTPELRHKLELLGYIDIQQHAESVKDKCNFLQTYSGYYMYERDKSDIFPDALDCGDDEDLFLVIAALRKDTDFMQFFTDGREFMMSFAGQMPYTKGTKWHKARVEELIAYFSTIKDEERCR